MGAHGGWFGFGGGFMWLFWLLIIVAIAWGIKRLSGKNRSSSFEESPLEILKKRYAGGEIDEEESERRRLELEE